MRKNILSIILAVLIISCSTQQDVDKGLSKLTIAENQRYFADENGNPFFWLGDTGWLLFKKCNREETVKYLEDRKQKGFNVIQAMVIHDIQNTVNYYGDTALLDQNVATPLTTEGSDFADTLQYDFWDHVDFAINTAEEKGIYMALVPIWGSNVKGGHVTNEEAKTYAAWLANRYKDKSNIIWLNGGDIYGTDSMNIWKTIGNTINQVDTNHLITFHPRGRMMSSDWFHNEPWLDFNMFQSGHRRYDQDDTERGYGEDNWRFVMEDYNKTPVKPTLDGEPSYEGIPQGLNDTLQPYWNDNDLRRYAYWSVFAGAAGFTYGHSAIMQFYKPEDKTPAYGAREYWTEAIDAPGAAQMQYLKKLMLSKPYFERVPDQSLVIEGQGEKYDHILATRGSNYAMMYTYTGNIFDVDGDRINANELNASWFNPRNGDITEIGSMTNQDKLTFDPPGEPAEGNDWVLILEY